jgi:hypothetical protein
MSKTATVQAQQKWEYTVLTRATETYLLADLGEIGLKGWELVSITHGKDRKGDVAWTGFLKRPFLGQRAAEVASGSGATDTVINE